jgi:nucleoside-diphosphate-sugar epimerase
MSANQDSIVLVTGISGFVGLHTALALLKEGYRVRGTLRSQKRAAPLREAMARHTDVADRLELVDADLSSDAGWADAVRDCRFVHHIASPIPSELPRHEDDLIVPAREGALRVLRAASEAGVQRVVMTSSLAAVVYGHDRDGSRTFDERDWSIVDGLNPYEKSKTLAERAAWDFANQRGLDFATINPGLILGPLLTSDSPPTSSEAVRKFMAKELPGVPNLGYATVDVRDVAAAHVAAMTAPGAGGERFCCAGAHTWMAEIVEILNRNFADRGYKIPTRKLPNFVIRATSLFDKTTRLVVQELGKRQDIDSTKIRDRLGWKPRGLEETVVDTGESLIAHGLV